jgi:branched-chain amino acid transport system substrate-binding protein
VDAIAVRDARAAGWTGPIVVPPTSVNPGFHPAAGPAAEGVRTVAPWLAAPQQAPTTQPHIPTMRRFAESFEAANGPAGTQAGYGADAVSLAHLAFLGHRDRKMARGRLDQMCCVGVTGVYNMTPADHAGLAGDALTPMTSQSGVWTAG